MLMDRGPQRSPSRPKRFGSIDPFCWIPVVSLVTIAALMIVSGAAPIGAGLVVVALLLVLFDSWVNRPDPNLERSGPARRPGPPDNQLRPPDNRPRPPRAEQPYGGPPRPPQMRNRPVAHQQPPRADSRPGVRQPPPPPMRRPGPRSGAGA